MANSQNEHNPEQVPDGTSGEINLNDVMYVELGRTGGPPRPRTVARIPKQWQPPKNENTPNRRIKRT